MGKIYVITYLLLYFVLLPKSLAQEKENDLSQLSLKELGDIVITPSKFSQSISNVTQKIDVINSDEIETSVSGNRNLSEVISKLPGASVTVLSRNDANWGTYEGIGPKYITYMLDGLPLDGFIDPMSLDLNVVDHIEVQRGPASVLYPNYLSQDFAGNQSPLVGTVNIILKQKIEQPKTLFESSYGSYNTINAQVFHQGSSGLFNYFCGSTVELSDYTNYGSQLSWLNIQKDPEYSKIKIYSGATYYMDENEKQKLTLFLQKTWDNGDKGRVYQGFDFQYGTVNAGYQIMFNNQLFLQSHIGIRSYGRSWQNSNFGAVDTLKSESGVDQTIVPMDLSLSWKHGNGNILSAGADYQNAKYSTWDNPLAGYQIYGNKCSASQSGLYVQEEWLPAEAFVFRGGLRYAYIQNKIELVNGNAPDHSQVSWDALLWSAGARYKINNAVSLFANGGSSFAAPGLKSSGGTISMSDLGVPGHDGQLPNPDLKAEKGISADFGIDFTFMDNYKLCVRGFYTEIQDAIVDIVVSSNPSQTQSINTGLSRSTGGEIELTYSITSQLSWYANATYMGTNVVNNMDENQNNVEIPFAPDFVSNLGFSYYSTSGFVFIPSFNYNNGFYDGLTKNGRNFYKPGVLLNLYAAQTLLKNDSCTMEGFAQLYNITNNKYEMPWQFQNPGFSGMIGIKVSF